MGWEKERSNGGPRRVEGKISEYREQGRDANTESKVECASVTWWGIDTYGKKGALQSKIRPRHLASKEEVAAREPGLLL